MARKNSRARKTKTTTKPPEQVRITQRNNEPPITTKEVIVMNSEQKKLVESTKSQMLDLDLSSIRNEEQCLEQSSFLLRQKVKFDENLSFDDVEKIDFFLNNFSSILEDDFHWKQEENPKLQEGKQEQEKTQKIPEKSMGDQGMEKFYVRIQAFQQEKRYRTHSLPYWENEKLIYNRMKVCGRVKMRNFYELIGVRKNKKIRTEQDFVDKKIQAIVYLNFKQVLVSEGIHEKYSRLIVKCVKAHPTICVRGQELEGKRNEVFFIRNLTSFKITNKNFSTVRLLMELIE